VISLFDWLLSLIAAGCLGGAIALHPATRPLPAQPRVLVRKLLVVAALAITVAMLL
jgi:hypothetical protein